PASTNAGWISSAMASHDIIGRAAGAADISTTAFPLRKVSTASWAIPGTALKNIKKTPVIYLIVKAVYLDPVLQPVCVQLIDLWLHLCTGSFSCKLASELLKFTHFIQIATA